jgi:hypothetical protein
VIGWVSGKYICWGGVGCLTRLSVSLAYHVRYSIAAAFGNQSSLPHHHSVDTPHTLSPMRRSIDRSAALAQLSILTRKLSFFLRACHPASHGAAVERHAAKVAQGRGLEI